MRPWIRILSTWGACFLACCLAAFWNGTHKRITLDSTPGAAWIDLDWSADEVTKNYWGGEHDPYRGADLASYLLAGRKVLRSGKFHPDYVQLWPPGMPFLIAAVLALTGPESYPFKMIVLGALLFSIALASIVLLTPPSRRLRLSIVLTCSVLLLPQLREWTFGFGSLMSETSSHAFFILAIVATVVALRRVSIKWALLAALCFALAAYLRVSFEMQGNAFFAMLGLASLIPLVFERTPTTKRRAAAALIALIAFNAALLPWRLYKDRYFGTTQWFSPPATYTYGFLWKKDHELAWFQYGANAACHADPERCEELFEKRATLTNREIKRASRETFLKHPFAWISFKLRHSNWLWFNRSWSDLLGEPAILLEGLLLLILGIGAFAGIAVHAIRRRDPMAIGVLLVAAGIVGINLAIFMVLPFEWRYSQTLRTMCFLLPIQWSWLRLQAGSTS